MADPVAEALWSKVVEAWDDEGAHRKFMAHCQATEQLAEAARLYRTQVHPDGPEADEPGRQADARKRLGAVAILAMATLDATRQGRDDPKTTPALVRGLGVAMFLGLLLALAWLLTRL